MWQPCWSWLMPLAHLWAIRLDHVFPLSMRRRWISVWTSLCSAADAHKCMCNFAMCSVDLRVSVTIRRISRQQSTFIQFNQGHLSGTWWLMWQCECNKRNKTQISAFSPWTTLQRLRPSPLMKWRYRRSSCSDGNRPHWDAWLCEIDL